MGVYARTSAEHTIDDDTLNRQTPLCEAGVVLTRVGEVLLNDPGLRGVHVNGHFVGIDNHNDFILLNSVAGIYNLEDKNE